jgi:hypothetical protein
LRINWREKEVPMGLLSQTLVLYLVVGIGVAVAVYLSAEISKPADRWFRVVSAVPFWPVYIPILLAPAGKPSCNSTEVSPPEPPDEMAVAIHQVDAELEAALGSLDGWAEDVLTRENARIHELRSAWTVQAERIREMDRLLALPEGNANGQPELFRPPCNGPYERIRNSWQARQHNIERLERIRQRAYGDLMGTLAWVRELVSMIHLAKFTGAPPARTEELVAQIAAAVEGLSEVTWTEEPSVSAADSTSTPV